MANLQIDDLLEKAVAEKIKKDMKMVNRSLHSVTEKFSFLFDGDLLLTQRALIESSFSKDKIIFVQENDESYFDSSVLLAAIPFAKKQEIYDRILNQLFTTVELDEISGKKE